MTHSERLEREAEETRAEVEHTLAELRVRMSPGQMVERATDYLRGSDGRAFVDNLRRQVVDNPLPATLIGAGIAWLALSTAIGKRDGHHAQDRHQDRQMHDRRMDDAGLHHHRDNPYLDEPGHPDLRERWDDAKDAISGLGERAGDTAEAFVDRARDETRRGARRVVRRVSEYGRAARAAVAPDGTLVSVAREQPMLVAGLGLAIGAALGALLPATRAETRVMGEASRTVRDEAMGLAEEVAGPGDGASRPPARDWDNERGPTVKSGDTGVEAEAMRAQTSGDTQSPAGRVTPYAEAAETGDRS